jgi:hypothetical protein
MSYNKQIADQLMQSEVVHKRMPNAEYVAAIIEQLRGVDPIISSISEEARNLRVDLATAKRSLSTEEELHRQCREELRLARLELETIKSAVPAQGNPEPLKKAKRTKQQPSPQS